MINIMNNLIDKKEKKFDLRDKKIKGKKLC